MVNRAGRSKGCSTCRRRHIKCDEEQPVCRRCQRCNFKCDGPRPMTIISQDIKKQTTTQQVLSPKSGEVASMEVVQPQIVHLTGPLRIVGFEVYICYTQNRLRRDGLIFNVIRDIRPDDIATVGGTAAVRRVSHQAILSFATILFGTQHQQVHITGQGYQIYGQALRQLNQALSLATGYTTDEVIVAVATLAISECLVPTGPENNLKHMAGLERLIALRDPREYWSHNTPGFREGVRFMVLFASMQLGQPSILATPNWKNALRSGLSYREVQEQDLFDVLADCTVLACERNTMVADWDLSVPEAIQKRDKVGRQAYSLVVQLHDWRMRWDSDAMHRHSDDSAARLDTVHIPESDDLPTIMLMLYNMALTYVLQIHESLSFYYLATEASTQKLTSEHTANESTRHKYPVEKRIAALETCRQIQHYMDGKQGLDPGTPPIIHWAISTVWEELRYDDSVEGNWMRELLSRKGRHIISQGLWSTYKWLNSLPE